MPFDCGDQELRFQVLEKIDRVIDLLAAKERWCKRTLKTEDGRMCVLGAVREADAELLLYAPILRAIREVTGHAFRQIEKFNDSWVVTHPLVLDVLAQARRNLQVGIASPPAPLAPAPRPRPVAGRWFRRLVSRLPCF